MTVLPLTLNFRDVEDLLAERGLDISDESVRCWGLKFEAAYARKIRRIANDPAVQGCMIQFDTAFFQGLSMFAVGNTVSSLEENSVENDVFRVLSALETQQRKNLEKITRGNRHHEIAEDLTEQSRQFCDRPSSGLTVLCGREVRLTLSAAGIRSGCAEAD